jgi:DNA end-binding protein Ku
MAARSTWKGAISCGPMNIPCKLFTATEEKKIRFNQLHTCGSRINEPKTCPQCQRQVDKSELKKGYEWTKGQYVTLEENELAALKLKSIKAVEILEFVKNVFDPRIVNKSYFLAPEETGLKAFAILTRAMEETGLAAIGKVVMREREHLVAMRPFEGILLLQTLFYQDELRDSKEVSPDRVAVSDKEVELGKSLVNALVGDGDLSKYRSQYRDALNQLIQAKLNGEVIEAPALPTPQEAVDLVEQLTAAVAWAKAKS